MTPEQAQGIHEERQRNEADHDRVSCWCCCFTCDFDYDMVTAWWWKVRQQ